MISVGVVGLGVMGQHHVRIYSEAHCNLEGVVDVDRARAEQFAEKYRTKCYTSHYDLINKVDAISLAVPTSLHSSIACDFLKQGVHCLVEKPIASSVAEATEMSKVAKKHKAKLMVGHIERFNPAVVKLKQLIDQGYLGKLIVVSTRRVGPFVSRGQDAGIIIDSAIHDIDVVRYLLGRDPSHIYSKTGSLIHDKEDYAIIVLGFDDAVSCLEVNWFTPHKVRTLVATGSNAICYLDYIKQELQICSATSTRQINIEKVEPLKLEIEHFLNCINNNLTPLVDAESSTKALEIAILAATGTGQRIFRTPRQKTQ